MRTVGACAVLLLAAIALLRAAFTPPAPGSPRGNERGDDARAVRLAAATGGGGSAAVAERRDPTDTAVADLAELRRLIAELRASRTGSFQDAIRALEALGALLREHPALRGPLEQEVLSAHTPAFEVILLSHALELWNSDPADIGLFLRMIETEDEDAARTALSCLSVTPDRALAGEKLSRFFECVYYLDVDADPDEQSPAWQATLLQEDATNDEFMGVWSSDEKSGKRKDFAAMSGLSDLGQRSQELSGSASAAFLATLSRRSHIPETAWQLIVATEESVRLARSVAIGEGRYWDERKAAYVHLLHAGPRDGYATAIEVWHAQPDLSGEFGEYLRGAPPEVDASPLQEAILEAYRASAEPILRMWLVRYLCARETETSRSAIQDLALRESSSRIRRDICEELSSNGPGFSAASALSIVAELTHDQDTWVREAALAAHGKLTARLHRR